MTYNMTLFAALAGLFVIIVIMNVLSFLFKKGRFVVHVAKAGDDDNHFLGEEKTDYISPFETFNVKGKRLNPRDFTIARVDGDCMVPRGIHSGDLLFIQPLKNRALKVGDIVYIKYERDGYKGYKLREYCGVDGEFAITRYYTSETKPKESTPHHKMDNVVGVVKYSFAR